MSWHRDKYMARIALPLSKHVRRLQPEKAARTGVFVPRVALPDGSRVFVRDQGDQEPQRVALPRKRNVK